MNNSLCALFVVNIFVISLMAMDDNNIQYVTGKMDYSAHLYTADGWGREPLARYLETPIDIVRKAFPLANESLSIIAVDTMRDKEKTIGVRHCNLLQDWLKHVANNLSILEELCKTDKEKIFLAMLKKAYDHEFTLMKRLKCKGIAPEKVVHNCGLMVLSPYEGKGIGSTLQESSINMLAAAGMKAIVCETTNEKSARIMKKFNFKVFKEHSYKKDFNIDFDGVCTIWFKELKANS